VPLLKNIPAEQVVALRAAEKDIDQAYLDNPLLRDSLGTAVWALLSFVEDLALRPLIQGRPEPSHRAAAIVDDTLNALKFPLAWLHATCERSGALRRNYDGSRYQAAWDLLDLARKYYGFSGPFQYWNKGELSLRLDGTRIIAELDFEKTAEYEAYNRLIDHNDDQEEPSEAKDLAADLDSRVRVKGDRFTICVTPRVVERVIASVEAAFRQRFTLPENWKFSRYSLREFRLVYLVIFALSTIHRRARVVAAAKGCVGLGLLDAVIVTSKEGLISRVARYTGLPTPPIRAILEDLTYASRQLNPDPALQPLIHLSKGDYAVSPFLWLHSAPERNLCALLNRLPEERAIYSGLKADKEGLMRSSLEAAAKAKGWRTVQGRIPGRDDLGDIDLAIISDAEASCLLLELKWFIAPAEVREIFDRREELQKGITQVQSRIEAVRAGCPACRSFLSLDPSVIDGVVVSRDWIGDSSIQTRSWPVIAQQHLLAKLNAAETLHSILEWLRERRYLPILGKHFSIERPEIRIGKWATEWYAINSLIDGPFLPL
jgi:hypothetical protein